MGNTQEASELYAIIIGGLVIVFAGGSLLCWFTIRFVNRILEDIKTLFSLHKGLKCADNSREIGEIRTEIEWLKRGSNDKGSE